MIEGFLSVEHSIKELSAVSSVFVRFEERQRAGFAHNLLLRCRQQLLSD